MKLAVSIIVPAYNVEPYVRECLDSLVRQTLVSKEIIVVDDGSTDKTLEILREYAGCYPFLTLIHQSNSGASVARNAGLRAAKGDYVMFVDGDDFIDECSLEYFYSLAIRHNTDIVRGKYYIYHEDTGSVDKHNDLHNITSVNTVITGRTYIREALESNQYEVTPVVNLYRRSYLLDHKIWFLEGVTHEDHEHTLKALVEHHNRLIQTDRSFYYYRMRSTSVTRTPSLQKCKDVISVATAMEKQVEIWDINPATHRECLTAIAMLIYQLTSVYGRMQAGSANRRIQVDLPTSLRKIGIRYAPVKLRLRILVFAYCPRLFCLCHKVKRRSQQ
ncbi:MAG: glycosyltransferase [Armatimonadota bacterium]|nr:glycosyltransferase [bacterium]